MSDTQRSDWTQRRVPHLPPQFWARPMLVVSALPVVGGAVAGMVMRPDHLSATQLRYPASWIPAVVMGEVLAVLVAVTLGLAQADQHARLVARDGAFVAGVGRVPAALCVIVATPLALSLAESAAGSVGSWTAARWAAVMVEVTALVSLWAPVLVGRPRLVLCPSGLVLVGLCSTCWVPWEAFDAEAPMRPGRLPVARPRLVRVRGLAPRRRLPNPWWGWLAKDAHLVRNMVGFYLTYPEHRPAIGTAQELDALPIRLEHWFATWFPPAGRSERPG